MDITLCEPDNCSIKETCLRYRAEHSEYQSYFNGSPLIEGKCDFYIEYKDKKSKKDERNS